MEQTTIAQLIQDAGKGNKQAFETIVHQYSSFVYRVSYRIVMDKEEAQDIVQETFIRLWKNLEKFNSEKKFTTWLYKITTNLCLDYLKSKKRKQQDGYKLNTNHHEITNNEYSLENKIMATDLIIIMQKLSQKLTPIQKVVFTLYFIEDRSLDEIAIITGYKKGNIKSNIYYSKKNMHEMLMRYNGNKNIVW